MIWNQGRGKANQKRILAAAIGAATALFSAKALAADGTWNVDASGNWTNPANWQGGMVPSSPGDVATFGDVITFPRTVTLNAPLTIGGITFDSDSGYAISGTNTLRLSNPNGALVRALNTSGNGVHELAVPISLLAPLTISNQSTGVLTISGRIAGTITTPVNVSGGGRVRLAGDNSEFSGAVTVSQGILELAHEPPEPGAGDYPGLGSGAARVTSGGALDLDAAARTYTYQGAVTNPITLSGTGPDGRGALRINLDVPVVLTGKITLEGGATIGGATALPIFALTPDEGAIHIGDPDTGAGELTGTGPLTKVGHGPRNRGPVQINVRSTHTGGTRVNEGVLIVSARGSLVGTGGVTVAPAGSLRLDKPAGVNPVTHSVDPNSVTLQGGLFELGADLDPRTILSVATTGGGIVTGFNHTGLTFGGIGGLDFNTLPAGDKLRLGAVVSSNIAPATTLTAHAATRTFRFGAPVLATSDARLTINSPLADVGGNPTSVDQSVGGTTVFNAPNTYSGQTVITRGAIEVTPTGNLGTADGGADDGTIVHADGALVLRGGVFTGEHVTLAGGAIRSSRAFLSSPPTIAVPIHLAGGGSILGDDSYPVSINSPIEGNGDLILAGVKLNSANAHTGTTTVTGPSQVQVNHPQALGGGSGGARVNIVGGNLYTAVPLTLASLNLDGNGSLWGSATVSVQNPHLEVRGGGIAFSAGGALVGVSSITKTSFGDFSTGEMGQAFNPSITIELGRYRVGPGNGLGSGDKPVILAGSANALLDFRDVAVSNDISLNNATGFAFSGALTSSSDFSVISGNVALGDRGSVIGGPRQLRITGGVAGGRLTKVGNGVLSLEGPLSYTGATTIGLNGEGADRASENPTIRLTNNARLLASSGVTVNRGGTLWIDAHPAGRVADSIPIALNGGKLRFATPAETVGPVSLRRGQSSVEIANHGGSTTTLTFSSLARSAGATFVAYMSDSGNLGSGGTTLRITDPPPLTGGIVGGWAHAWHYNSAADFATYDVASGYRPLSPSGRPGTLAGATPASNVRITSVPAVPLAADVTVNSLAYALNLADTPTIDLGGRTVNVVTGGLLGGFRAPRLINGKITAGGASPPAGPVELFVTDFTDIAADIVDNGPTPVSLVVSGRQTLRLSGNNTYTGATYVNGPLAQLWVDSPTALPQDGHVHLNGGGLRVMHDSESIIRLASVAIRDGGILHGVSSWTVAPLDIGAYDLESGHIGDLRLIGSGPMTKTTPGTVYITADTSRYSGAIRIDGGILAAGNQDGVEGEHLGRGPITVNAGGRLVQSTTLLHNPVTLNGGELAPANGHRTLSGPLTVAADSTILTIDGLYRPTWPGHFVSPAARDLTLAGPVTFGPGAKLAKIGPGTLTFAGPVTHGGNNTIHVSGGAAAFTSPMTGHPLGISLAADDNSVVTFESSQRLSSLSLSDDATLRLSAGASGADNVLRTVGLAIGDAASLDLADNALILDYDGDPSPLPAVRQHLASNRITSSLLSPGSALGYAEAADVLTFTAGGATFVGESVDPTTVLVRFTFTGDVNLDGAVDFVDLARLAQNYNQIAGETWSSGDFNHDGAVDFNDLAALAQNYNSSLPAPQSIPGAPAGFEHDLARAFANVPEPALLGFLGLAALATSRVRRPTRRPLQSAAR